MNIEINVAIKNFFFELKESGIKPICILITSPRPLKSEKNLIAKHITELYNYKIDREGYESAGTNTIAQSSASNAMEKAGTTRSHSSTRSRGNRGSNLKKNDTPISKESDSQIADTSATSTTFNEQHFSKTVTTSNKNNEQQQDYAYLLDGYYRALIAIDIAGFYGKMDVRLSDLTILKSYWSNVRASREQIFTFNKKIFVPVYDATNYCYLVSVCGRSYLFVQSLLGFNNVYLYVEWDASSPIQEINFALNEFGGHFACDFAAFNDPSSSLAILDDNNQSKD